MTDVNKLRDDLRLALNHVRELVAEILAELEARQPMPPLMVEQPVRKQPESNRVSDMDDDTA